ncbi:hypothetical protein LUZ60_011320 [Juncus effusus]|nr:hypothetical protein LUZ60_011320 [Juncus effusus]
MSSLQDSLNRFKQQQEKCQTTLKSISRAGPSNSHKSAPQPQRRTVPHASPLPSKQVQALKFSDDTERLKHIYDIEKLSVGAKLKLVIDLLYNTREAFTPDEIYERRCVKINGNQQLLESLQKNVKVHFDGRRYSYKAKHDLGGKDELLHLIRKHVEGLPVVDVKDSYEGVLDDLQALKADNLVWLLSNMDSQEDIVYPNDPKAILKVDDDIKELFRSIELPRDMVDIERELQKNGMKPATNTAQRRAAAQVQGVPISKPKPKKKRNEITKRTKLTNAHLPELFQNLKD